MRNGFTFYRSWYEMLDGLDDKTFRLLIEAILEKGLNDKDIEMLGIAKNLFIPVKPILEKEYQKYVNGQKGGAPIGNSNAVKNGGFDIKQPKNNQKQANEKGIMYNVKGKKYNDREEKSSLKQEDNVGGADIQKGDLTFDKIYDKYYHKCGQKRDRAKSMKVFNSMGFSDKEVELILKDEGVFKLEYKLGIKDQQYRPKFDTYIQGLNIDSLSWEYRLYQIAKYHKDLVDEGEDKDSIQKRMELFKEALDDDMMKILNEQFRLYTKQKHSIKIKII